LAIPTQRSLAHSLLRITVCQSFMLRRVFDLET
jgi:hypothetical protein